MKTKNNQVLEEAVKMWETEKAMVLCQDNGVSIHDLAEHAIKVGAWTFAEKLQKQVGCQVFEEIPQSCYDIGCTTALSAAKGTPHYYAQAHKKLKGKPLQWKPQMAQAAYFCCIEGACYSMLGELAVETGVNPDWEKLSVLLKKKAVEEAIESAEYAIETAKDIEKHYKKYKSKPQ